MIIFKKMQRQKAVRNSEYLHSLIVAFPRQKDQDVLVKACPLRICIPKTHIDEHLDTQSEGMSAKADILASRLAFITCKMLWQDLYFEQKE